MDSREKTTLGSGIGGETAKFHQPTLESVGMNKYGSGFLHQKDNTKTFKRNPRIETETYETFHSPILKNTNIYPPEKLRIQTEQRQREQLLSPKVYKSPGQKDEIERSLRSNEYQSGPLSHYRSNESFRSSSARKTKTDESMRRIQRRLDALEKELDEKLEQDYITNKDLMRRTGNVAMTSDSKFQPVDTDEDRYERDTTPTYKRSVYVQPFEDHRKEQFKHAFDKHEKRILQEEYEVEKTKSLPRSDEYEDEEQEQEDQIPEQRYKSSSTSYAKQKTKSATQLFFETQIGRLK
jgi:hypothetical protein